MRHRAARARPLSDRQRVAFFRRFGEALAVGVPALTALESLERQTHATDVRSAIACLMRELTAGTPLPEAFARTPGLATSLELAVITASDAHGGLPDAMASLADAAEVRMRFRRRLQLAMLYPALVCVVGAGVVAFLVTFVIPRFTDLFVSLGHELPPVTRALLAFAGGCTRYGPPIIAAALALAAAARLARRTTTGRVLGDWLVLHAPGARALARRVATARFARAYGLLTAGGVAIGRAVRLAGSATGNTIAEQVMINASHQIDGGTPLSAALRNDRLFDPRLREGLAGGEQTGQTDVAMQRLATMLDASVRDAMTVLTTLPQVILVVVLSALVLWIAVAIMLPWFQLPGLIAAG